MALISIIKGSKDFGIKTLFKDLNIHINKRERLGLIGPNGSGKSTLLKIIAGIEPLFQGERQCSPTLNIKIVQQDHSIITNRSILEEVLEGCGQKKNLLLRFNEVSKAIAKYPDDEKLLKDLGAISNQMDADQAWNLEQQCKEILRRLGIKDLDKPIKELSGGYRKRIGLASALVANPDILLLDEPTNHLDAAAVEWLQSWLEKFKGALVLVTHDRYVLDRVTSRMIEVSNGQVHNYLGNYSSFLKQKLAKEKSEASTRKKFQGILRKELAWLKQGPKARSTKQKARLQRIVQMKENNKNPVNNYLEIVSSSRRIGKITIEAEGLHVRISKNKESTPLIENFTYSFRPEDRVGFIGENGSGKSTLLNLISGKKKPQVGKIKIGETVHIGYLDQHTDVLKDGKGLNRKVIEFVEESALRMEFGESHITASQLLERFLFSPAQQHSPLSKLSGGEKRRLTLCKILIEKPNVLLLDEPTNDLDIETLNVLEDLIDNFKGCVIVVSHDRYFLDRTVNRIFNFQEGKITQFEGNYSDFLEKQSQIVRSEINKQKKQDSSNKNNYSKRNEALTVNNKTRKMSFKEVQELKELEKNLPLLEKEKASIEKMISEGSGNINELSIKLADIIYSLEISEERWIELSDMSI